MADSEQLKVVVRQISNIKEPFVVASTALALQVYSRCSYIALNILSPFKRIESPVVVRIFLPGELSSPLAVAKNSPNMNYIIAAIQICLYFCLSGFICRFLKIQGTINVVCKALRIYKLKVLKFVKYS